MVDPADDLYHHGDEEPCCADELPVPAWSRRLVHRRGAGSAFVRARPVTASSAILESAVLCLREGRILSGLGHTIAGMSLPPRTALIPMGVGLSRGCPRARAALYGPVPPASRVLRIGCATACGRPGPGSLYRPWGRRIGQAGACPMVRAARARSLGVDRVVVTRAGSSAGEGRLVCRRGLSGVGVTCHAAVCGLLRGLPPLLLVVGC